MTPKSDTPSGAWWKPIQLQPEACAIWTVGTISLVACRTDFGWKCAVHHRDESGEPLPVVGGVCRKVPEPPEADPPLDWQIFTFRSESDAVRAVPRTTDRAVVFKPEGTLILPPGEDVRLTLDSPPTVEIRAGRKESPLLEHPSEVLSETWFGTNTTDGECCYSATYPLLIGDPPDSLPLDRIHTDVRIVNKSALPLRIPRLRIPLPNLSVYATAGGGLWTEAVQLVSEGDWPRAGIEIRKWPPKHAGNATRISSQRVTRSRGLTRAFGELMRALPGTSDD